MSFSAIARRSVGVVALGAAALTVAGIGIARATTDQGGVVLGGVANHTLKPTGLINKKGPALALTSSKKKPPFTVNSSKLVKHLNAAEVGGKKPGQLTTSGSAARSSFASGTLGHYTPTPKALATTATLAKGTYYVTASVTAYVSTANSMYCAAGRTPLASTDYQAAASNTGLDTLSTAVPVTLSSPGKIGWYCWISGAGATDDLYYYAGITAIRVSHSAAGAAAAGSTTG